MKSRVWMYTGVLLIFLLISGSMVIAQEVSTLQIDPSNPEFRTQFSKLEFKDRFAVLATSDGANNYFMADFSQLPGKFEKIWFLNLIFQSSRIVNIDPGIDRNRVWFLASRKFSEKEVLDEFEELKVRTMKESSQMTETEKSEWMKINDKYK